MGYPAIMLRMAILVCALCWGFSAGSAAAQPLADPPKSLADEPKSERISGVGEPCTPTFCSARRPSPWTHAAGFGAAVVTVVAVARRDPASKR